MSKKQVTGLIIMTLPISIGLATLCMVSPTIGIAIAIAIITMILALIGCIMVFSDE